MRKLIKKYLLLALVLTIGSLPLLAQEIGTVEVACPFEVNFIRNNPLCAGDGNGSIELIVTNNDGTVDFTWMDVDPNGNVIDGTANDLTSGTYNIIISDNGCTDTIALTLEDPEPVEFELIAEGVTCIGEEDGVITVEPAIDGTIQSYSINNSTIDQASNVFS